MKSQITAERRFKTRLEVLPRRQGQIAAENTTSIYIWEGQEDFMRFQEVYKQISS
jgi:hypothetical protein